MKRSFRGQVCGWLVIGCLAMQAALAQIREEPAAPAHASPDMLSVWNAKH